MVSLNFWECKAKINKYLDNKLLYIKCIDDAFIDDVYEQLNKVFNYGLDINLAAKNMVIKESSDYTLYEYTTVSPSNTKIVDNMAIVKNGKPVFFASSLKYQNGNLKYFEEAYKNYREENGHLDNKLLITSKEINNSSSIKINIEDRPLKSDDDYSINKFSFDSENGNILLAIIDDELCDSSDLRIQTATKKIADVTTSIIQVVDKLSGVDNVKEYQVKRKVRK